MSEDAPHKRSNDGIKLADSSHLRLFRKSGTTHRIAARDSYNVR